MIQVLSNLPSDADVSFYRDNGYWVGPKILSDAEVEALRVHHAQVIAGKYETGRAPWSRNIEPGADLNRIVKIDNSHWSDAELAKLAVHPVIGAIAARLAGVRAIRLWHDQLLFKPPDSGKAGNVGWHQDNYYWQCAEPPELLTAWVALDDVTLENGCMEVVPGSHRWGLLTENDFFEQDLDHLKARIESETGQAFQSVPLMLPAGGVSFHHCRTIHGSNPNRSQRPRRSLVVHLMPDGTIYHAGTPGDGHMNVKLFSGADGSAFAGPYFPLLWREGAAANPWDVMAQPSQSNC